MQAPKEQHGDSQRRPAWNQALAARYLLGQCLHDQKKFDKAADVFLSSGGLAERGHRDRALRAGPKLIAWSPPCYRNARFET